MKYIDADRLRAEIERRLDELNPKTGMFGDRPLRAVNPKTFPRESELEKVLGLIDSLQQDHLPDAGKMVESEHIADVSKMIEQPEVELEDVIRVEFSTRAKVENGRRIVRLRWEEFNPIAHYFYELGLTARKEE